MKAPQYAAVVLALSAFGLRTAQARSPHSGVEQAQEITVDRIFGAWSDREKRVLTAQVEWSEQVFHGRGSLLRNPNFPRPAGNEGEPEILPPEDTIVDLAGKLAIDGRQARFERRGPVWLLDHARFSPRDYISVFGEHSQGQHFSEVPGLAGAMTFLSSGERAPHAHDLSAFPVSSAVRPVDAALARLSLEGWQLEPATQRVAGRECVVLVRREGDQARSVKEAQWSRRMWVDPQRDFALVQFEEGQGDNVYHHLEIEHALHPSGEWLPSAWKCLFYTAVEPDKLRQQIDGRATRWQVNEPVPTGSFEVPAPPRTWVRSPVAPRETIVRTDGSRRPILEEELRRGATHWQLIESEPGQAALPVDGGVSPPTPLLSGLDFAVAAGIVMGLVACFAVSRWRRQRAAARVVSSSSEAKE